MACSLGHELWSQPDWDLHSRSLSSLLLDLGIHVIVVSLGFPGHKTEMMMLPCLLRLRKEWGRTGGSFTLCVVHEKHPINISYYCEMLLIQQVRSCGFIRNKVDTSAASSLIPLASHELVNAQRPPGGYIPKPLVKNLEGNEKACNL